MDGYAGSLGVREQDAADGHSRLDFTADDSHLNPAGSVHGGVLATLADIQQEGRSVVHALATFALKHT